MIALLHSPPLEPGPFPAESHLSQSLSSVAVAVAVAMVAQVAAVVSFARILHSRFLLEVQPPFQLAVAGLAAVG
jgi:hypothetical protein